MKLEIWHWFGLGMLWMAVSKFFFPSPWNAVIALGGFLILSFGVLIEYFHFKRQLERMSLEFKVPLWVAGEYQVRSEYTKDRLAGQIDENSVASKADKDLCLYCIAHHLPPFEAPFYRLGDKGKDHKPEHCSCDLPDCTHGLESEKE